MHNEYKIASLVIVVVDCCSSDRGSKNNDMRHAHYFQFSKHEESLSLPPRLPLLSQCELQNPFFNSESSSLIRRMIYHINDKPANTWLNVLDSRVVSWLMRLTPSALLSLLISTMRHPYRLLSEDENASQTTATIGSQSELLSSYFRYTRAITKLG